MMNRSIVATIALGLSGWILQDAGLVTNWNNLLRSVQLEDYANASILSHSATSDWGS